MVNLDLLFGLLIAFQLKHWTADYPLQGMYMLGKMKAEGWVLPLLSHTLVHGGFTLIIVLLVSPTLWWLAVVDIAVHFIVDRIKASPKLLNRWGPDKPYFWWTLGLDQMMHHLTHYFIIYKIVTL